MSGICGIVLKRAGDQVKDTLRFETMVNALRHGEDGSGHSASWGAAWFGLSPAHSRICSGMATENEGNRPISLMIHGTRFPGMSEQTGVEPSSEGTARELLSLYLRRGIDGVCETRGDYAAAVWDARESTLHLITDRFRVHPIFYYEDPEMVVFSSRMSGLWACPFVLSKTIEPRAVVDIMALSAIPTDRTIFREVKKLPPGHVLTVRNGQVSVRQYWDIDFLHPDEAGERDLTEKLKASFEEAVAVRLSADGGRSIGAFLSGGIDSSTVTGMMTRLTKSSVKCFSIGFGEARFNEMEYARIAARHFGAEHHEYYVTPQDTIEAIPKLLMAFDEPFANASAIPTYFCAKVAREHGVEVMYAGDGGDELFAGNERYGSQRIFDYYTKLPGVVRNGLVKPVVTALADLTNINLFVLGKKYIRRASIPLPDRLYSYGLFSIIPPSELLTGDVWEAIGPDYNPYEPMRQHYLNARANTDLDRFLYLDLKITISDNDLFKVTRMTQAAGVDVRFPFLDHRLAEFAASIPAKIKMPGRDLRVFFKRAYSDLLPTAILTKTKHGFGLPIPVWLRTDKRLSEMMHDLVLGPRTIQRGIFRKSALELLIERHRTESGSFYGDVLWNVMIWELWMRTFWDGRSGGS